MKFTTFLLLSSFVPHLSLQVTFDNQDAAKVSFASSPSIEGLSSLVGRQQQPGNDRKKTSCDRCAKRKCKGTRYRDRKTCKCTRCRQGLVPNPAQDGCIPDKKICPPGQKYDEAANKCVADDTKNTCPPGQKYERAANMCVPDKQDPADKERQDKEKQKEEERRKKKEKLTKETIPRKKTAFKKKMDDKKKDDERKKEERRQKKEKLTKETIPRKKTAYTKKIEDNKKKERADKKKQLTDKTRGKKRVQFQTRRKRIRSGKCLLLVPLSIYSGLEAPSEEFLTDFFSEEFVSSDAMDEFWPEDFQDPLDVDIDNEDYINKFVEIAAKVEDDRDTRWKPKNDGNPIGVKRDMAYTSSELNGRRSNGMLKTVAFSPPATEVNEVARQHTKRNPLLFIARIIVQFAGRLGAIGVRVAGRFASVSERVSIRLANLNARGGARLAKDAGTKGRDAMTRAGRAISKDKNWKNCLNGALPV